MSFWDSISDLVGPLGGVFGAPYAQADQKENAAMEASKAQQQGANNALNLYKQGLATANQDQAAAHQHAFDAMAAAYDNNKYHYGNAAGQAIGSLNSGFNQANDFISQYAVNSSNDLSRYFGEAQDTQRQGMSAFQQQMSPYQNVGNNALGMQADLAGTNGFDRQQQAINNIQNSPLFAALAQQGESALLQNASATGGLRGGNTQGALAQFRPAMLQSLINQQYGNLSGLSGMGQNAVNAIGNSNMGYNSNISNLQGQLGMARSNLNANLGQQYGQNALGLSAATAGIQGSLGDRLAASEGAFRAGQAQNDINLGNYRAANQLGYAQQAGGLYGQIGGYQAGESLARGQAKADMWGDYSKMATQMAGMLI